MPVAASQRQWRMMQAIIHGGHIKAHPRGRPPRGVAEKYTAPPKDAPESKDNDRGGSWTFSHHKAHREGKSYKERSPKDKKRDYKYHSEHWNDPQYYKYSHGKKGKAKKEKDLKKAFEEFYKGKGRFAATLIMDNENKILLGVHCKSGFAYPGGSVEPNESFEEAALREMVEECGAVGRLCGKIWEGTSEGNEGVVYLTEIVSGKPKSTDEIKNWKWYDLDEIPWERMRSCCIAPLKTFINEKFGKSLRGMLALEALEKSGRKEEEGVVEINQKFALKLVGVGLYRYLKNVVADMGDEDFKEIDFDTYKVSIRRHTNDTYSGRVSDGHKVVYQYAHKSLHELAAALMSIFEWYLPEDADVFEYLVDDNIPDDAIHGGLRHLMENYKRYNLGEIYQEMETIREQIRNGVAVDLQQVEAKLLKLFDRLEETTRNITDKHNSLAREVGKDVDELEAKLRELQAKIDDAPKKTKTVEAFSTNPADSSKIYNRLYSYLSKPKVEIEPNGKITISFGDDWEAGERANFLEDMRAKVLAKKK